MHNLLGTNGSQKILKRSVNDPNMITAWLQNDVKNTPITFLKDSEDKLDTSNVGMSIVT